MTDFDEAQHPRSTDGTFAEKQYGTPEVSLGEIEVDLAIARAQRDDAQERVDQLLVAEQSARDAQLRYLVDAAEVDELPEVLDALLGYDVGAAPAAAVSVKSAMAGVRQGAVREAIASVQARLDAEVVVER